MRIELSLLSILSTAFLLVFCSAGGELFLDSLSVDFSLSSSGLALDINPTWLVWVSEESIYDYSGSIACSFGNVIAMGEHLRGTICVDYVLAHERIHVDQYRSLGWWMSPAKLVLGIEQPEGIAMDWNDPTQPSRTMWAPPDGWEDQWSFITLTFDREGT